MVLGQFSSIEALKEAIITGSSTDQDLLDWEYEGKVSAWLDQIEETASAEKLREVYNKDMGDKEQFSVILKVLSFSMEEIEKLTNGQSIPNPYAKQIDTLESLSRKVVELQKLYQHIASYAMPVGTISLFSATSVPAGWIPCEGQSLPKVFYKSLYLQLGNTWKGMNIEMFGLPNLKGEKVNPDLRYCIFTGVFDKMPEDEKILINYENKEFTVNGVSFVMIEVKGGEFEMGSSKDSAGQNVSLSTYYIGQYLVTQKLWKAVMEENDNPSYYKGDTLPVETVSWDRCQEFIRKLNELMDGNFRLPTEAEWEFAARGGTRSKGFIYSGSDVLDHVGWYEGNSQTQSHPIGMKQANELGIYDMSGNVCEWCQDWYDDDYYYYSGSPTKDPMGPASGSRRVGRGGSWSHSAGLCAVSFRNFRSPVNSNYGLGFRLAFACSSK